MLEYSFFFPFFFSFFPYVCLFLIKKKKKAYDPPKKGKENKNKKLMKLELPRYKTHAGHILSLRPIFKVLYYLSRNGLKCQFKSPQVAHSKDLGTRTAQR